MKWFKHDAYSMRKASIERIIMEFGIDGYGLYYACVELIAGEITIDNLTFELEHDAQLIAHKFKMDTLKVEQIMHRCIELGLFDLSENGKIRCMSLAKMLDESISKNAHVKEIKHKISNKLDKYQNSGTPPEGVGKPSSQNRIEENRIEKNREEKKREEKNKDTCVTPEKKKFIPPTLEEVKKFAKEKEFIDVDCERFWDYYDASNWKRKGGVKLKSWEQAVRNWQKDAETCFGTKKKELSNLELINKYRGKS